MWYKCTEAIYEVVMYTSNVNFNVKAVIVCYEKCIDIYM